VVGWQGRNPPQVSWLDSNGKALRFDEVTEVNHSDPLDAAGIIRRWDPRASGRGFAFMKSTRTGWENYCQGFPTTTIPPDLPDGIVRDPSMVGGHGKWSKQRPTNYRQPTRKIRRNGCWGVFSTTYKQREAWQDRPVPEGGSQRLPAGSFLPEISDAQGMACRKHLHFILMKLSAFGLDKQQRRFSCDRWKAARPDQIECTVGGAG